MTKILPPSLLLSPASASDDRDFLMFDNFPGPFSDVNGKAPVIGSATWNVTGPNATAAFSGGGKLSLNFDGGNAYVQMALGEIPGEIGCVFELLDPLLTVGQPVLACYPTLGTFAANMFHFIAGNNVLGWHYWKNNVPDIAPAWTINNNYALSTNSFFTYRILIDPPYAFGFLFDSAGTLIGNITINEPNMASVIGPCVFFQQFSTKLSYRSVWARRRTANSLAQATMVRGAALHVGPGTPSGILSARYDGSFGSPAPKIAAYKGNADLVISGESAGNARLVLSTSLNPFLIAGASIANAGAGYQVNDLLIVQGGTVHSGGSQAQLRVDSIGPGGAITAISVVAPGLYDGPPAPAPGHAGVAVNQGSAEFILMSTGTTVVASKIELQNSADLVFRDTGDQPWLIKPGNNDSPYVPGGIRIGGSDGPVWLSGSGIPEGLVSAPAGSLFSRSGADAGARLYVKSSGTGTTGWKEVMVAT